MNELHRLAQEFTKFVTVEHNSKPISFAIKPYYYGNNIWDVRDDIIKDGLEPATISEIASLILGVMTKKYTIEVPEKEKCLYEEQIIKLADLSLENAPSGTASPILWGFTAISLSWDYTKHAKRYILQHDLRDGKFREMIDNNAQFVLKEYLQKRTDQNTIKIKKNTIESLLGKIQAGQLRVRNELTFQNENIYIPTLQSKRFQEQVGFEERYPYSDDHGIDRCHIIPATINRWLEMYATNRMTILNGVGSYTFGKKQLNKKEVT